MLLLLLLLQLDESATRVPRALMLRSGPVLRAFPEKQSICKVGRGEKKKKKKEKLRFSVETSHPLTLLSLSNLVAGFSLLSCLWLNYF